MKKKTKKKKKPSKKDEDVYDCSSAIFTCEQKGCKGRFKYNFSSNRLSEIFEHDKIKHKIKENSPQYYKQNIEILKEKTHITDIQLVRTGKDYL